MRRFHGHETKSEPPPKIRTPTATASNRAKVKKMFLKLGRGFTPPPPPCPANNKVLKYGPHRSVATPLDTRFETELIRYLNPVPNLSGSKKIRSERKYSLHEGVHGCNGDEMGCCAYGPKCKKGPCCCQCCCCCWKCTVAQKQKNTKVAAKMQGDSLFYRDKFCANS